MPELPEVETVVRELRTGGPTRGASVVGKTIASVTVRWPRHIATPSAKLLKQQLPGQAITGLRRRGKYLIFELSRDVLLIHLKMSGDLLVVGPDAPADKHAHTIFHFTDGTALRFSDTRKFGKVFLVGRADDIVGKLGPEPLEPGFTAKKLGAMLAGKQRQLKPLLLDQTFLAGLGNIYTDESLNLAGLHPLRMSNSLTPAEVRALWLGIRKALRTGLRHNGASIDWVYRGGGYQHHFRVYDRAGQPCLRCGTPIRRMVVGQRGTHYCPTCQTLSRKVSARQKRA
jgi:formamidopyrimidine-DNA glycosylase